MNIPGWLWFVIALILLIVLLKLVGHTVHVN